MVSWHFLIKLLTIFAKRLHPGYLMDPKSTPGYCILILPLFYQMINWKLLTIFAKRFHPNCLTGPKSTPGNCILILSLFYQMINWKLFETRLSFLENKTAMTEVCLIFMIWFFIWKLFKILKKLLNEWSQDFCLVNFEENHTRKSQFWDTLFKIIRIMYFFHSRNVAFSPPEILHK